MAPEWLEPVGLAWLRALEDEAGFAEAVVDGVAVRGVAPTGVTQARLGYSWSHLACLFPHQAEFARAAAKSFALPALDCGARVYDHDFYLLFMAWYYRLTRDESAIDRLKERYALIQTHLGDAGVGGFGPQPAGLRSHNPYMHLLEALLVTFRHTGDDYWLTEASKMGALFFARLRDPDTGLVFEFLNSDWSVAEDRRIEIGHQLEWPTLLLELHEITGKAELLLAAARLNEFTLRYGFENGLAINAVDAEGNATDRAKLLWVQTEAIRRGVLDWEVVRQRYFHANGWSWYNRLAADGTPIEEPSNARLLYHIITAGGAGSSGRPAFFNGTVTRM